MNNLMTDAGKLILRITLGLLILLHGISKLLGGIGGVENMLQSANLPAALAYGVFLGELVGPILLTIGWYARIGALLIAINMVFAFVLAHTSDLFRLTEQGGWALELQGMYLASAVTLALIGPGGFSVNRK